MAKTPGLIQRRPTVSSQYSVNYETYEDRGFVAKSFIFAPNERSIRDVHNQLDEKFRANTPAPIPRCSGDPGCPEASTLPASIHTEYCY